MSKDWIIGFCWLWMAVALATFVLLFFVSAPYGRHIRKGWGPTINNNWGWVTMEFPSFAIMLYFLLADTHSLYNLFLFGFWLVHYFNRTFIFPFRIRTSNKQMPLAITGSAVFFNCINAFLNGYYLSYLQDNDMDFNSWPFYIGAGLFIFGFYINQKSDSILIRLRNGNSGIYSIPNGFLFRWISCPNHLGEIIEWLGFALMAWNLPAMTFLAWTLANLIPRAIAHHHWYQAHFDDYPKSRKALLPYLL